MNVTSCVYLFMKLAWIVLKLVVYSTYCFIFTFQRICTTHL